MRKIINLEASVFPNDNNNQSFCVEFVGHVVSDNNIVLIMKSTVRLNDIRMKLIEMFSRLDFSTEDVQNKICGGQGCNADSLQSQIKLWSKVPSVTYIGSPAQSWLDDYFGWGKDCCQFKSESNQENFCPSDFVPETSGSDGEDEYGDFSSSGKIFTKCTPTQTKVKPT